jgi:hypothetical protein
MTRQRGAFAIGVAAMALTALAHLAAVATGLPEPANEAEATLFQLLNGYEFEGLPVLTLGDVLRGLSLAFSVFLLGLASIGLVLLRSRTAATELRAQAVVLAGVLGILTAVGIGHYPLPATALLGTAFLAFVASIAFARAVPGDA